MESAGLCTAEEFLKEANEGDFSAYTFWQYVPEDKEAPNRFMKCEGYLFPETYEFLKDDTVHNYVATFYAQFDAQFTKEMYAALKKQGMTLPELVTLASFVQEEAGNSQDSNVAQVFRNRLAEARPTPGCKATPPAISRATPTTTISGTGSRPTTTAGTISRKISLHLRHLQLYRPARRPHLEPRPCRHQAALEPQPDEEAKDAYFFVTDLKGNYYYAHTLAEHNANCKTAAAVNKSLKN